jgi:hypothetical protein
MSESDSTSSQSSAPSSFDPTPHESTESTSLKVPDSATPARRTKDQQVGVRCKALSKQTGKRCGQFCAAGFEVCKWHGGGAPQVKRAAQERLEAMVNDAITDIESLSKQRTHLPTAFNAARHILDRGIGAVRGSEQPANTIPQVVIGIRLAGPERIEDVEFVDGAAIPEADPD